MRASSASSSSTAPSALSAWLRPTSHDALRSVDLVRLAAAAVLVVHPLHALAVPKDARDLAAALASHGMPLPFAMSWAALGLTLAAAVLLSIPRLCLWGASAGLVVLAGGAAVLYAPNWYVVGGRAVDGHPGVELNALLCACLVAVAWTYAPRRAGTDPGRHATMGLEIVRVASALSLLAHGAPAFLTWDVAGMRAWGDAMSQDGWPYGVALVWSIKGGELLGAIARLSRRLVVPACIGHLSYIVPGMWIDHHGQWFDVGPGEGGIEFSVVLVACTVACILGYWPRAVAAGQGATSGQVVAS